MVQYSRPIYHGVYSAQHGWHTERASDADGLLLHAICSPTSIAMLLAYWQVRTGAISENWKASELANAPIASSSGHLLIVAGFDEAVWQHTSNSIVYLIHPHGWPIPATSA